MIAKAQDTLTDQTTIAALGAFPLLDAIFGRRARRFGLGMEIPDGPLAYRSTRAPLPLSDAERILLTLCGAGVSGWNFGIPHTTSGAPDSGCNYPIRFTGRTYPSGAAIGASELLVTDESGSYITQFRNMEPAALRAYATARDLTQLVESSRAHIVQLFRDRVVLPARPPHVDAHNAWVANEAGSTLFVPVIDLTEVALNVLAMASASGAIIYDAERGRPFGETGELIAQGVLDPDQTLAIAEFEQSLLGAASVELGLMAYNIYLVMQAIGLGGWLYTGINAASVLGAYAGERVRGFRFRCVEYADGTLPNPVGLDRYFEGLCPPYTADMRQAVEIFAARKFGPGGTYDPARPGPFRDTEAVAARVDRYTPAFIRYLGSLAQGIYERFGKFPATLPSIYARVYVQAQHIDLAFYDHFFGPDAYLPTHLEHMERWHRSPRTATAWAGNRHETTINEEGNGAQGRGMGTNT